MRKWSLSQDCRCHLNETERSMFDVTSNLYTSRAGCSTCTNNAATSNANTPWRLRESEANNTGKTHQLSVRWQNIRPSRRPESLILDAGRHHRMLVGFWLVVEAVWLLCPVCLVCLRLHSTSICCILPRNETTEQTDSCFYLRNSNSLSRWVLEPPEVARSTTSPHRECWLPRFDLRPGNYAPLCSPTFMVLGWYSRDMIYDRMADALRILSTDPSVVASLLTMMVRSSRFNPHTIHHWSQTPTP